MANPTLVTQLQSFLTRFSMELGKVTDMVRFSGQGWQAANGQEVKQKEVLISKIKGWGANTTGISKKETATASVTTLGRSIRYPLAATTMSTEQCKTIDKHLKSKSSVGEV